MQDSSMRAPSVFQAIASCWALGETFQFLSPSVFERVAVCRFFETDRAKCAGVLPLFEGHRGRVQQASSDDSRR